MITFSFPFNLSFTRYPVNVILPYKEGRQSHRQILTTDDQNLTVLDFLDHPKIMSTERIKIGNIYLTEGQIYQVGIREILCILSLHFGGWSEKTGIQGDATTAPESNGYPLLGRVA